MGWMNRELRPDIGLTRHFVGWPEAAKRGTAEARETKTDMEPPFRDRKESFFPL